MRVESGFANGAICAGTSHRHTLPTRETTSFKCTAVVGADIIRPGEGLWFYDFFGNTKVNQAFITGRIISAPTTVLNLNLYN